MACRRQCRGLPITNRPCSLKHRLTETGIPDSIIRTVTIKGRLQMHLKGFLITVLSVFATLLLPVSPALGQTLKGTILGTITDATHAVIPGVAVNIIEVNT